MRSLCTLLLLAASFLHLQAQHAPSKRSRIPSFENAQRSAGAFIYSFETLNGTYADLENPVSISNDDIWDDPEYVIELPFSVSIGENTFSTLYFAGLGAGFYGDIGSPDAFELLLAFECDLVDRGAVTGSAESPISYQIDGAPGNRIYKIEFKNAGSYEEVEALGTAEMFVNFQLWLYEGSHTIEVHMGPSHMTDEELFYSLETGAVVGCAVYDQVGQAFWDDHFLDGDADNPELVALNFFDPPYLVGTPSDGIIYRFYLADVPPTVTIDVRNATCELDNGIATAAISGGTIPYTFLWSNGETTQSIGDLPAGIVSVTITDGDGSTASASAEVVVVPPVVANAGSTNETFFNANNGTAWSDPIDGIPPYTFIWSNGSEAQYQDGLAPGNYRVTVTDASGCTDWQAVDVLAFDCPEMILNAALSNLNCASICDGSIAVLSVDGAVLPLSYQWSTGSTDNSIDGLCAGVYSVTVTDANNCPLVESFEIFTPEPILLNAGSTDETDTDAQDGTAWVAPAGGIAPYTYAWSTGATDSLITGLVPGFYTITVTDANLCTESQYVIVNAFGCDLVIASSVIDNSCFASCDGAIALTSLGTTEPSSYDWSDGQTGTSLSNLCAGTYSVTVTNGLGCFAADSYTITQPDEIVLALSSTDESQAGSSDGSAWVEASGGQPPYTYVWSTGSTDSLIVDLGAGTYALTVTDGIGCSAVGEAVVEVFVCLTLEIQQVSDVLCFSSCEGGLQVIVNGGVGPFSYIWNIGDTTALVEGLCAGVYTVVVFDESQGCGEIINYELGQPELFDVDVDEVVYVTDSTAGSISITAFGGTPPYTYWWLGPENFNTNDEDISGLLPGLYIGLLTDANGCAVDLEIEILDETVGVKDLNTIDVVVAPNPAQDQLRLAFTEQVNFTVQMIALDGRVIGSWENMTALDVRTFPSGVYTLSIIADTGYFSGRVVIMH